MPPDEREAFISFIGRQEPQSAASLRCLLEAAAQPSITRDLASAIQDTWQAVEPSAPLLSDLAKGERIGPYRVLRLLGRGGMAPVYLAERADGVFSQQVAVKVVPIDLVGAEALGRFEQERQILANLNHPNIARLLDGGIDDRSRSFIVMEYVDGQPIDRFCDERRLSLEARLDVFAQVADAVQCAHRNLVIHRDLKPSNILVTGAGVVKLLDFGIAKLLHAGAVTADATPHTRTILRRLTPEYASPEQWQGANVTTASDVYQLGLLLYELLTGTRANGDTTPEGDGALGPAEEPRRPSVALHSATPARLSSIAQARRTTPRALAHALRGDLDNIVLKALEQDPQSRYESPASMAHDLHCQLRGLPVSARNATAMYRLGKFIRRHKAGVATAAVLGCAFVAFIVTVSIQAITLRIERDRVALEASKAAEIRDFLSSLFDVPLEVANPTLSARDLIDAAAARVANIDARQPLVRAQTMHTLGGLYIRLGVYDRARALLEESLALRRAHLGDRRLETAESMLLLGMVLNHLEDHAQAESLVREAVDIGERVLGPNHWGVAFALTELGTSMLHQSRREEAQQIFTRAAAIYRRHPAKAMGAPTNSLGLIRAQLGDPNGASRDYREALAINIARFGPDHPLVQTNRANLAAALLQLGNAPEAEAMLRGVVGVRRRLLGSDHPDLGTGLTLLAKAVRAGGNVAAAEPFLIEALEIFQKRYPPGHSRIANVSRDLAQVRAELGSRRNQ